MKNPEIFVVMILYMIAVYKEKLVMPVYIESKKEPYLFDIDVEMIIG